MKAIILNSGIGSRMGNLTSDKPKCMTQIMENETILSRQLKMMAEYEIKDIIITTGYLSNEIIDYCNSLELPLNYTFVNNDKFKETNYIYSLYLAREACNNDDIILMHGDLVFESRVLESVLNSDKSCMVVSSNMKLPVKDFKAVLNGDRIEKIGINYFNNAVAAQALYHLRKSDWKVWLDKIVEFCENGKTDI